MHDKLAAKRAPVGSTMSAENKLDTITSKWHKQPKFLECIRNPEVTSSSLERGNEKKLVIHVMK